MLQKFFIFLAFVFLSQGCLIAQTIPDHPLKMADLIELAMTNSPETRQIWWNAKRAAAALGSAYSAYYPLIGLDAHVTNGRDFKFINGPDADYTITGANLTLSFLLYDYGERDANVTAAKMALIAAKWQTDWVLQSVLVRVFENAYNVLNLQETLHATLVSTEDAEKMLDAAVQLNQAGLTPVTDVYTSQAQVFQARMHVIQQQGSLDIQKAQLASSLGLMADTPLTLAPIDQLPTSQEHYITDLIQLAMTQRADLMAKHARVAESRALLKKTQRSYLPKISLTGAGGANHDFNDIANGAQYHVKLSVNMPLFDGFNHNYQNRMAYADLRTSIEELAKIELDIAFEVLSYSTNLQTAQKMITLADENLKSTKMAYEGVLATYKAGKIDIAVLSNALRQLAAARISYSEVRTKLLVAAANLAFSTGTLLPYVGTSCKKSS